MKYFLPVSVMATRIVDNMTPRDYI